eukprot:TRINITY_DN10984_c0_g1_i3.p1 TRINITY_DN10984_c0_g1~~TRINITY_DN10984_c0_g1_i3.p1  ORF type:complete len:229 (+),score=102.26 TRINITY_DN10984_c0_g1_i3:192-878(+)
MFWGCIISEGKPYAFSKTSGFDVAHISNVSLSKDSGVGKTYLLLTREKETFTLACLQKDKVESHSLDLYLKSAQGVTLSVSGKGEMHVSGYLEPGDYSESEDEEAFLEGNLGNLNDKKADLGSEESEEDSEEVPKKAEKKAAEQKKPELKKNDQKKQEQKKPEPKAADQKKQEKKKEEQKKQEHKKHEHKREEKKPKIQKLLAESASEGDESSDDMGCLLYTSPSPRD